MLMRAVIDRRFTSVAAEGISQTPSHALLAALGGERSLAGVPVTETTANGIAVVFACDRVIREDVAKTPIKIMRRGADGSREPDPDHPVYSLLHDLANPVMTASEFKDTMQHYVNLWGNAYAEIQRDARMRVVALWPLEPARMRVEMNTLNQLVYTYERPAGGPKTWIFDAANPPIFHLRQNAVAPHWWIGRSPIRVAREAFGIAAAQERYQARHFGQGGHAQMQLTTPSALTIEAANTIRQDYERLTRGEENWHRPILMPFGLEAKPLAMPHRDAQFVDTLKLTRSQLAGLFRVPPHKVGDLDRATFSNIEHQAIEWATDGLMPHFTRWEQAIARDLLNAKTFTTHYAKFAWESLIRGDMAAQMAALAIQRQNGVASANDWRRFLDQNPISAEDGGDLYLVNGNMIPMTVAGAAPDPPAPAPPAPDPVRMETEREIQRDPRTALIAKVIERQRRID